MGPHASCTDCCIVPYRSYLHGSGGGGGCSCMLLLHPVPTSADAGPDFCTWCPDLWTWCLWCFPSSNWSIHSTCTGCGCHQLQLALVELFHSALAQIVHLHMWWYHSLQLALVALFHPATGANTALELGQLVLCGGGQWWWYVAVCGGGGKPWWTTKSITN